MTGGIWLRALAVLAAPIWLPLLITATLLWFGIGVLFLIFAVPLYWVATGEDITHTRYNIWGI